MDYWLKTGAFRFLLLIIVKVWELKGGKKQIFIKDMSEISLYIDSHLVGKRAKRIFSRRMWMVFGFGLNHTSESSVRAKHTIYLPSFLASIIIMWLSHLLISFSSQRIRYLFPKNRVTSMFIPKVTLWIDTVIQVLYKF